MVLKNIISTVMKNIFTKKLEKSTKWNWIKAIFKIKNEIFFKNKSSKINGKMLDKKKKQKK